MSAISEKREWNGWSLDLETNTLISAKAQIALTRQQAEIMNALISAQGKFVPIEKFEDAIWPNEADMKTRNSIKVQFSKLRERIRPFLEIKSAGYGTARWKLEERALEHSS